MNKNDYDLLLLHSKALKIENQQLKKEKEEINNDCLRLVKEYNTIKQENSQLKELSEQFKHDLQYTEHHIVNELKQENEKLKKEKATVYKWGYSLEKDYKLLKEDMKEETFYYQWQNCIDENEQLRIENLDYKVREQRLLKILNETDDLT